MKEKDTFDSKKRKNYWNNKYLEPNIHWGEDIHFGVFSDNIKSFPGLLKAIRLNTEIIAREILEISSIYSMAKEMNILDFGCGSGDLLFRLSSILPNAKCYGIDLSANAINKANKRKESIVLDKHKKDNLNFKEGGIETLEKITEISNIQEFDLIICRDMYYLLYEEEQKELFRYISKLLKCAGVFILADLAVNDIAEEGINNNLVLRQYGGIPIKYNGMNGKDEFSIQNNLDQYNLIELRPPDINHNSVSLSYLSAATNIIDDQALKNKYVELGKLAEPTKDKSGKINSNVPYVKFYISPKPVRQNIDPKKFGLILNDNFGYKSNGVYKNILLKGNYLFSYNTWSLIIGKSGVGKSTILNLISKRLNNKNIVICNIPKKIFYLQQTPVLVDEISVEANVALYGNNIELISKVLTNLGLNKEIRKRSISNNLSGGEKQRVALGQAIVSAPDLLLLDEPCTGMDKAIKYQFFSLLRSEFESKQISILCVDHDYYLIESFFDHIYEINNGYLYQIK